MREARNAAQAGALWLTLLLEVAAAVPTDWDNRGGWHGPGIVERAITAWQESGRPGTGDYIFRLRKRDTTLEAHHWQYEKGDAVLVVSVEARK